MPGRSQVECPEGTVLWSAGSKAGLLSVGSSSRAERKREKEGEAERNYLAPRPLCPLRHMAGAQERSSAWERGEKRCNFHICLSVLVSDCILTGTKLNSVLQIKPILPRTVTSQVIFLSLSEVPILHFAPAPLRKGRA